MEFLVLRTGRPMLDSDGSIYVEYEQRAIPYPPTGISATLSLLKIATDETTSTVLLASSSVANLFPGNIIPDGNGGVLATGTVSNINPPAASQPYQAAYVSGGAVVAAYPMPNAPASLTLGPDNLPINPVLVLGENGTAFASYGSNVTSFQLPSGSPNWNYQAPPQSGLSIVGALGAGTIGVNNGQLAVLQLNETGAATQIAQPNSIDRISYSWFGAWDGFSTSSGQITGISLPMVESFASLWANPRGGPSANGRANRPWYFILNWQNSFDFIPDNPTILPDLKVDITNQVTTIKTTALQALQKAYKRWPVIVVEGTQGTGDHQAVVQTNSTNQGPSCGSTNINTVNPVDSEMWYECNMEPAQWALGITINNAQDESAALNRSDLIQAIGRGIGNNAAHEIAHQFLIECCSMDAMNSADPNAPGTYNNGSSDGDANPQVVNSDPSPWTGFWKDGTTPIHWENTTQAALDACLMKGWVDFRAACSAKLHLTRNRIPEPLSRTWAKADPTPAPKARYGAGPIREARASKPALSLRTETHHEEHHGKIL